MSRSRACERVDSVSAADVIGAGSPIRLRNVAQNGSRPSDCRHLYDALSTLTGSPVVAINRALTIAQLPGAGAALEEMPDLAADARLRCLEPH